MAIYYLGVDGGGTNCRVRLSDADLKTLGEAHGGRSNLQIESGAPAYKSIMEGTRAVFAQAGIDYAETANTYACFGMAGGRLPSAREAFEQRDWPFARVRVYDDIDIARAGALGGEDGGAVIIGTGSAALALVDGKRFQCGGWGFHIGDQMSGAILGRELVRYAVEAKDDLCAGSPLCDAVIDKLGDKMSLTLLEKFTPGDVYHVDSVVQEREVKFASAQRYGTPMLQLNQGGGLFTTRTIQRGSEDEVALQAINRDVIKSLGLVRGVTHIEYIKSKEDGKFYFLEAGARVGAARIPDVIWHATGICLWHEWARIEIAQGPAKMDTPYDEYAGTIITLANRENPDLSGYTDPEIVYRQARKWHAGLIVRSKSAERVEELLNQYAQRFQQDFMVHVPLKQ